MNKSKQVQERIVLTQCKFECLVMREQSRWWESERRDRRTQSGKRATQCKVNSWFFSTYL